MFERRLKYVAIAGALFFCALGVRLFTMQVVAGEHWRAEAAKLSFRHIVLAARRGGIYDRHGVPLAEDRLEFDIQVRLDRYDDHPWRCKACGRPVATEKEKPPGECAGCGSADFEPGEPVDWSRLPGILGITSAEFRERFDGAWKEFRSSVDEEEVRRRKSYDRVRRKDVENVLLRRPWTLIRSAGPEAVREVSLNPERYRGLSVRAAFRRATVEEESLRSLVGSVGPVTERESGGYREQGLSWTRIWRMRIGRSGLERGLEEVLGGRDGWREVDRDRRGRVREILDEEPARDGGDVKLSIDARLQVFMSEVLDRSAKEHKAKGGGAFVAVDARTGEILVLVSSAGEASGGLHLGVAAVMPGSVFKVVTALGALEAGTVDPEEVFVCAGPWHKVGCSHDHGPVNLVEAISGSCNKYFARVADGLGILVLDYWATQLGFGRTTGTGLPLESAGLVPTPEWRAAQYEQDPERWEHPSFQRGELWRVGFGQGPVLVTPVQVARLMAVIANDGRFVDLALRAGEGRIGERVVSPRSLRLVKEGLEAVVTRGTARRTGLDRFRAVGKTGTAEIVRTGKRHVAWFAGYAPAEDPRVAFACCLRDTPEYGAEAAGPVVFEFLEEYFTE